MSTEHLLSFTVSQVFHNTLYFPKLDNMCPLDFIKWSRYLTNLIIHKLDNSCSLTAAFQFLIFRCWAFSGTRSSFIQVTASCVITCYKYSQILLSRIWCWIFNSDAAVGGSLTSYWVLEVIIHLLKFTVDSTSCAVSIRGL